VREPGPVPKVRARTISELNPRIRRFGREKNPVLVVDDVLVNPTEVRDYAIHSRFVQADDRTYYPGYLAPCALHGLEPLVAWVAQEMWSNGHRLDRDRKYSSLDEVDCNNRYFAICAPDPNAAYRNVHVDGHSWLAIVLYLSLDLEATTGTAFWRHKGTGMESFYCGPDPVKEMTMIDGVFGTHMLNQVRGPLAYSGAATYEQWSEGFFVPRVRRPPFPDRDHDGWKQIGRISARYNRLVAYPTWQWHGVYLTRYAPPPRIEDARLTLNLFVTHPLLGGHKAALVPAAPLRATKDARPTTRALRR
jgi:hypothetical protein